MSDDLIKRLEQATAALAACVEYWRDHDIPCPPALHDQVTDALHEARAAIAAKQDA